MIDFSEEVISLVQKRENLHPDDPAIQLIWNELINLLKQDEESTILFLDQCDKKYLYWISEIFEELSAEFQSRAFIDCLLRLQKKYPDLDMEQDIEYAIQSIEE
ncbi:hypothetical protein QUF95_19900 [Paenibacillus silvae]|jgi:hypothetical protein|uniref:hypothetical protein n=1 Tax=Paenibacillus silvae TaxID=1325358 RepID=UPI0025A2B07B|nr:hypothetical protein [Paenibacillus silvae]MDM5279669.1 hypothetical protein [Paenibacillus silvae]